MRDDAPPGVNNIGDASIADLGLLHNVRHLAEIELDARLASLPNVSSHQRTFKKAGPSHVASQKPVSWCRLFLVRTSKPRPRQIHRLARAPSIPKFTNENRTIVRNRNTSAPHILLFEENHRLASLL